MFKVSGKEFDDWTAAQDAAVKLLDEGIEYVNIMQWNEEHQTWGLIQELNLERGIVGQHFSTHSLAPYYVRLRNYEE